MTITPEQHDLVIAYFNTTQEMLKQFTRADLGTVMKELSGQKYTWRANTAELIRIELQYGLFEKMLAFKVKSGEH